MEEQVLYRKWRPKSLTSILGQKEVVQILSNSIISDRLSHSFVFSGPSGTGKTSTAIVFAKSINCSTAIEKNLSIDDCTCNSCNDINNYSSQSIIELDAASSIRQVEDLTEVMLDKINFLPGANNYKVYILDEVHMLSRHSFNALLKTLEEPPEYLKFIFATTEIKKIPITVVSRCQRFDLSRIKSTELFEFIKKIKDKENGKVTDDALKLIVKISEGSVRDALSLLDRALLSLDDNIELDLHAAQKIFGYFDKSQLIDLFQLILNGEENKVINIYRKIYDQGVEPKVFINDFLEILYYFKNINSLTLESTNFSLNDEEFSRIKDLSNQVDTEVLILFWQFAISSLEELDIVSNQHLSIEMFLIRLMHLSSVKPKKAPDFNTDENSEGTVAQKKTDIENVTQAIDQIKNIAQEKKNKPEIETEIKAIDKSLINSFNDLLDACLEKKEIKLKYELEKNVNLVKFERNRIEISFNDNLDKDFVKDLSAKLFEWTSERWIITFSKSKGEMSVKEKQKNKREELINEVKNSKIYKTLIEKFPDAELTDVKLNKKED